VTYYMNRLQNLPTSVPHCVTLNAPDEIAADTLLGTWQYAHPVYTRAGFAAQARHAEVNRGRTSFCGAYWGYGFHEDGVRSALAVTRTFGEDL
jgi:predicted NAD/FAD-binding protein